MNALQLLSTKKVLGTNARRPAGYFNSLVVGRLCAIQASLQELSNFFIGNRCVVSQSICYFLPAHVHPSLYRMHCTAKAKQAFNEFPRTEFEKWCGIEQLNGIGKIAFMIGQDKGQISKISFPLNLRLNVETSLICAVDHTFYGGIAVLQEILSSFVRHRYLYISLMFSNVKGANNRCNRTKRLHPARQAKIFIWPGIGTEKRNEQQRCDSKSQFEHKPSFFHSHSFLQGIVA